MPDHPQVAPQIAQLLEMWPDIVATGEVRRRGKELIFCDVEIVEDNDARRLVATGSMI